MRKLACLVAGCAALLIVGAGPAYADNGPHRVGAGPVADSCAGCHRAHTAKAPRLLRQEQTSLCYTCHGSTATGARTDVEDGVGYSGPGRTGDAGALRGGGFSYALIDSANPTGQGHGGTHVVPVRSTGETVKSTHSVNGSPQTAWGNGPVSSTDNYGKTLSLTCGSCHDPHGNGNFRILKPIPKDSDAVSPGVVIPDASAKVYTTDNYWSVSDPNAPDFIANVAAWCSTCHTRYLAPTQSGKTSSGDSVFTYRHRSDRTDAGGANCIQCHTAHGSNAKVDGDYSGNVTNPDGTANSGSRLLRIDNRGICQMCHNK